MSARWPCLLVALLLGVQPSMATEPDVAPNYAPPPDSAEAGLWMVMEQAEKEIQRSPLLVRDEALNAYVKGLVCTLAGPRCGDVRAYILDIPAFNASMAPNGMMLVYTGLLLRAENEAQLSFVLGHEIGHYAARHTLQQFKRLRSTSDFLAFFSLIAAGAGAGPATDLAALVAYGALFSYSRDQEREADARGFETIAARGYDPTQGAALWAALIEEEKANPKRKKRSSFTASHPSPEERMQTLRKRAEELGAQKDATFRGEQAYAAATRSHRARWLEDELMRAEYDESLVLISRLVRDEPQAGELHYYLGELHYYLGELHRRRNSAGDSEKAVSAYRAAISTGSAPPVVHRALGLIAMKAGEKAGARRAFQDYLAAAPNADDRAMIEFYLTQL